jgi:autonomous glycyl radical cofactor GrcA
MLQYNDLKHLSAMTEAAADEAERLRKLYRRKTKVNNELRQRMLSTAVGHIEDIMVPVRSEVGKLSYREVSPEIDERLRAASKRAQLERHKLLKMLGVRARH